MPTAIVPYLLYGLSLTKFTSTKFNVFKHRWSSLFSFKSDKVMIHLEPESNSNLHFLQETNIRHLFVDN